MAYVPLPRIFPAQVPRAALDRAASATLRTKFAAGLFDNATYVNTSRLVEINAPATRALSRRAAAESIVLLKNVNGSLPLALAAPHGPRTVAVIGPNAGCANATSCGAAASQLGGYTNMGADVVTVYDAFVNASAHVGGAFRVTFEQGAYVSNPDVSLIPAAVAAARAADVAVVVLGHETIGGCGTGMGSGAGHEVCVC